LAQTNRRKKRKASQREKAPEKKGTERPSQGFQEKKQGTGFKTKRKERWSTILKVPSKGTALGGFGGKKKKFVF